MRPTTQLATILLAFAVFAPISSAQTATYQIDNSHTSLVFGIGHANLSYIYGRFNTVAGTFTLDEADPKNISFQVTIDAASVDTNDEKRDEHLRSPDFFDVQQFPTINFNTTSVEVNGEDFLLKGQMTLHGVTKDMEIVLKKLGEGPGPSGDHRAGFLARMNLKRSDYEMKTMIGPVGDDVSITFSFEGIRQ